MLKLRLLCAFLLIAFCNATLLASEESNLATPSMEDFDNCDVADKNETLETDNVMRINGGRPVTQVVPYQVSLQVYRRGRYHHFCSGSIISTHHVLTAAHCLTKMNANEITVVVGTLTWRNGGDRYRVVAIRSHPSFSSSSLIINDIAVLKVTPPFNLAKSSISTISLGGRARVGENVAVRLTGWGSLTPTGSSGLPEQLQVLDYRTISNQDCAQRGFRITANELCALGERGRGACVGDSGGPLIMQQGTPQLVGIVSYGTATCAQGRPDVYTRVSSFLPYINRVITTEIP
ncbi:chymotrypsin-1-like [Ceratitis capitata]|uniref:chymotrypsin-1-like n=1 Tax=Ceratitis capitata TaxID=7213 RepID=UPI00061893A4|nr:chymotrypsin-1-like [Ceratitis capitata]